MGIQELLKTDSSGLKYFDVSDVKLNRLYLYETDKPYYERKDFYSIEGIDDYIIKQSTVKPILLNGYQNKKLLRSLVEKQSELPEIGFPIGYSRKFGRMNGTIIPGYKESLSIYKATTSHSIEDLINYYNHSSDPIDNLVYMLLDILEILSKMYNKGVIYLDIKTSNFLIYHNGVKIIDFDPGRVLFKDRNGELHDSILRNYAQLVETICRRYGYKVLFNREDTFQETEKKVKYLKRELER